MRRSLVDYAFATASLVVLIVGVVFVNLDRSLSGRQVLANLGLNLIASVIFAVIFSWLSGRVQEASLQESLEDSFTEFSNKLTATVAQGNADFLPNALYPPAESDERRVRHPLQCGHDAQPGRDGILCLSRPPSARYVAARLRASNHYPQQVKVAMLSPGDTMAIQRRAADRVYWERFEGKDIQQLEEELRQELIWSVVSLFDYRRFCAVDLMYVEDTAVYRYEMFDDSVYISWYHGAQSHAKEMPESLRFPANSFLYKTLQLDLVRRFEISNNKVTFTRAQNDDFLAQHLAELLGEPVDQSDIDRWRQEGESKVGDFSEFFEGDVPGPASAQLSPEKRSTVSRGGKVGGITASALRSTLAAGMADEAAELTDRVLTEIAAGGQARFRALRHPLGFLYVQLDRRADSVLRLHLWPDVSRWEVLTTSPYHMHAWDLTSYVHRGENHQHDRGSSVVPPRQS